MSHHKRARHHEFRSKQSLDSTETQIMKFLSDHYGSQQNGIHARDIARGIGKKTKGEINKYLYGLQKKELIQKVTESPPIWRLLKYDPASHMRMSPNQSSYSQPYPPSTYQDQSMPTMPNPQQQWQPNTEELNVSAHIRPSTTTRVFDATETEPKEPARDRTNGNGVPQTSGEASLQGFAIPPTPQDLLNDVTSVFHTFGLRDKTLARDELEEKILLVIDNTNQIVVEDIVQKIPGHEINAINEALRSLLAKNSIKKVGRYYSLLSSDDFETDLGNCFATVPETVLEGGGGDSMNNYTADVFDTLSFFMTAPFDEHPSFPQSSTSRMPALPVQLPPQEAAAPIAHLPDGKNAISVLNEFAQRKQWRINYKENMSGPDHKRRFWMMVELGGQSFRGPEAPTKKDAKLKAAETALQALTASELAATTGTTHAVGASKQATLHDKVAALVNQKYNELAQKLPDTITGRKIIAGFVMTRKFKSGEDTMEVVSIGSGNRCVMGDKLSLQGQTVNDCHAEVISRRGLMRYFYRELQKVPNGNSIFTFSGDKCKLLPGIELHLYISTAPCGDGAIFAPSDATTDQQDQNDKDGQHHPLFENKKQGLLRTKIENGEGCIPIEEDTAAPTWDGILRGERLRTMSCSDKIAKWNFLGLQGSLLSHFLHPIYMSTLTLGMLYNHGHLTRAICCRVQMSLDTVDGSLLPPNNYKLHHPVVSGQHQNRETGKMKTREYSLNWCLGDVKPEVLDGTEGKCEHRFGSINPPRICKAEIFKEFKKLCDKYNQPTLYEDGYYRSKVSAEEYLAAKTLLWDALEKNGFGKWMPKPKEEKDF